MSVIAQRIVGSALFFWLLIGGFCLWYIMPLREKLRFGIDLVGGTYITVQVQTDKAIEGSLIELMQKIKKQLKTSGLPKPLAADVKPISDNATQEHMSYALHFDFENNGTAHQVVNIVKEQYRTMDVVGQGNEVKISFTKAEEKRIRKDAVERNIEVIRSRIDKLGVSETPISRRGEDNIIIELPDISDPRQAKEIIGKAAVLDIRLVNKAAPTEEELLYEYDGQLPSDLEILSGKTVNGIVTGYYAVPRYSELTGKLLSDAKASIDHETRTWMVNFKWNPEGGDLFYDLTSKNHGKLLAVVLDGIVITAPSINASIRSEGRITGTFDDKSAKELALLLKSGSFVAPITFEEERQVGPTLGQESIRSGLLSCLVGLVLIFFFSLFYYKIPGFLAFISLLFNLIIILFGLVRIGATLTLPGIAGMVLTVGMAIDASILVYERIKEELAKGARLKEAIDFGFSDAQWVILDGNITTFIVGMVLYQFGTGPIQGFAVTMMLGILATLVTGLFFLKSLFSFILNVLHIQKLKF